MATIPKHINILLDRLQQLRSSNNIDRRINTRSILLREAFAKAKAPPTPTNLADS